MNVSKVARAVVKNYNVISRKILFSANNNRKTIKHTNGNRSTQMTAKHHIPPANAYKKAAS